MASSESLTDRLRTGLRRTREQLAISLGVAEEPDWDALEESLVLADVGIPATTKILDGLRNRGGGDYEAGLRDELLEILASTKAPRPSKRGSGPSTERVSEHSSARGGPRVTMVVGVNGVGKTTSVAKLARLVQASGESCLVVAADTFRAAAQEQLATWAERAGVDLVEGTAGREPASVVHDGIQTALGRGVDRVLIDTAGRLHTKKPLMDELTKVARVADRVLPGAPHDTLLVMDATVGSNGLAQAKHFAEALDVTGIILTKMDGTAKGGVVLAIASELGLPVLYTGVGEGMDDLVPFSREAFVDALLSA